MFSFRRKPKKSEETSPIRTSPSLPDLKTVQGSIPWPEDLVDVAAIRRFDAEDEANSVMATTEESSHGGGGGSGGTTANGRPSVASTNRVQGATRISFSAGRDPVKFHKPFFRPTTVPTPGSSSTVGAGGVDDTKAPISSFYMAMATPAEALNQMRKKRYEKKEKSEHSVGSKIGQRRAKIPPAFNIMVCYSFFLFLFLFWELGFAEGLSRSLGVRALENLHCFDCCLKRQIFLRLRQRNNVSLLTRF